MSNCKNILSTPHVYPSGCFFKSLDDIKNKKIVVMGLGLNGGGEAAVRFLLKHGAYVIATDIKNEIELQSTINSLNNDSTIDKSKLIYHLGGHNIDDFTNADCVIKNPGIKYENNKFLAAAKVIETDISLFLAFSKAPIIAVTGSKGKSSTTSAIYYGLKQSGFKTFLGGNITNSPLNFLDQTNSKTPVVLELSSYQLADLRGRHLLKPYISVITKIVPDHQNFYHSMINYVNDKKIIYSDQDKNDFAIFDFDSDTDATGGTQIINWGDLFAQDCHATILRYSKHTLPKNICGVWEDKQGNGITRITKNISETVIQDLVIPGHHMKSNILNAALVLRIMGVAPNNIVNIYKNWPGIEHRLEFFHEYKIGKTTYKFYNDSAATVPQATVQASQSFEKPVLLLIGGTDKGLDLSPIAEAISPNSKNIIPKDIYLLSGSATDKIINDFKKKQVNYHGPFSSLTEMLSILKKDLDKNTNKKQQNTQFIVFSPGATSFELFKNEFDRGNQFKKQTKQIFQPTNNS